MATALPCNLSTTLEWVVPRVSVDTLPSWTTSEQLTRNSLHAPYITHTHRLLDMVRGMRHVRYVERNMVSPQYSWIINDYFNDKLLFMQEVHAFQADCVNDLVEPWGLVRTALVDWPPSRYDYSYAGDAGI